MSTTKKDNDITHKLSLTGLLVTLGIVFGDIGTSPLYVMNAIVKAGDTVNADYIIGAVSCIIWTITLQTTFKYVILALRADNKGEGGILALYALIRKHSKKWVYLLAIAGASTLVADGVITPSITVTSAVEGLKTYQPSTPVIPICICIVSVLFFIQQFGTKMIGRFFGPLMLIWFSMLGVLGFSQLGTYPRILLAFNPYYAIHLLITSPEWFLILGAVFLCTTGAEALYSDLGHCGVKNIRVSWAFVKTMLIANYLGQGAWIIAHANVSFDSVNPFYAIMPRNMLFFGIIMATIAAIIASQALISGSFTIFSEAMNLKFWPRQKIKYTTDIKGQLYIPFVNITLYILCIVVILSFQSSAHMEAAYGLAITITMLMTTFLLSIFLRQQHVNKLITIPVISVFVTVESIFLLANLTKFTHGGWVTMLLAGIIFIIMYIWYNGSAFRSHQVEAKDIRQYSSIISDIKSDNQIAKFATNVVYLSKLSGKYEIEQRILYSIINKHPMRADHYWLLHIDYQDAPSTLQYEFYEIIPNTLYRINLKLGFRIQPFINLYLRQIIEDLVQRNRMTLDSGYPSLNKHHIAGNFIFVFIHRVYAAFNSGSTKERLIMNAYSIVSRLKANMPKAFGLATSNVLVENVPLVVKRKPIERITPVEKITLVEDESENTAE